MLVFATNNPNKIKEVKALSEIQFEIVGLNDIGCTEDIPETADTIEGNAKIKAEYVFRQYKKNCFADDSGLEVQVLNGEPGVKSARYAGEKKDNEANIDLLLSKLKGIKDRRAQFKTVIYLIINEDCHEFTGIVEGEITEERRGKNGFGYDSVFVPKGYALTFAEMSLKEKNKISHRAIAVSKLLTFLNQ